MSELNLYEILGVKSDCTKEEISNAFDMIKSKHPTSSKQFKDGFQAYTTLFAPETRVMYDSFNLINCQQKQFQTRFCLSEKLFDDKIVKQYQNICRSEKSYDTYQNITVTLEDLYSGRNLTIRYKATKICPSCKGNPNIFSCPKCINTPYPANLTCNLCRGKRTIEGNICKMCSGKKNIVENCTTLVKIEKGMTSGERIRCVGKGNAPQASLPPGDLIIILKVKPHTVFERYGSDLFMTKKINITEALCGYKTVITHMDKRKVLVSSGDTVLSPGCKKVVKGEGMPLRNSTDNEKGDLVILFQIAFPENFTGQDKGLITEIEKLLPAKQPFTFPETYYEEHVFTNFDPDHKNPTVHRKKVFDDEKADIKLPNTRKDRCAQQ